MTEHLTSSELQRLDRFLAHATGNAAIALAARKRTGLRVGVCVEQGQFYAHVTAFDLNAKGEPKGTGCRRVLCGPTSEARAYAALADLEAA